MLNARIRMKPAPLSNMPVYSLVPRPFSYAHVREGKRSQYYLRAEVCIAARTDDSNIFLKGLGPVDQTIWYKAYYITVIFMRH